MRWEVELSMDMAVRRIKTTAAFAAVTYELVGIFRKLKRTFLTKT